MLKIKNYSKSYEEENICQKILIWRQIVAKLLPFGHNGSGKSTTIKSIAGVILKKAQFLVDGLGVKEKPLEVKKNYWLFARNKLKCMNI